jgi:hypothetical protein
VPAFEWLKVWQLYFYLLYFGLEREFQTKNFQLSASVISKFETNKFSMVDVLNHKSTFSKMNNQKFYSTRNKMLHQITSSTIIVSFLLFNNLTDVFNNNIFAIFSFASDHYIG